MTLAINYCGECEISFSRKKYGEECPVCPRRARVSTAGMAMDKADVYRAFTATDVWHFRRLLNHHAAEGFDLAGWFALPVLPEEEFGRPSTEYVAVMAKNPISGSDRNLLSAAIKEFGDLQSALHRVQLQAVQSVDEVKAGK